MINRNKPNFKNLLGHDKAVEKNIIEQYTRYINKNFILYIYIYLINKLNKYN